MEARKKKKKIIDGWEKGHVGDEDELSTHSWVKLDHTTPSRELTTEQGPPLVYFNHVPACQNGPPTPNPVNFTSTRCNC